MDSYLSSPAIAHGIKRIKSVYLTNSHSKQAWKKQTSLQPVGFTSCVCHHKQL